MKHLRTIILILFFPILSFGQSDYFVTDSALFVMKLIDGGELINSRLCRVKKGKETIDYSPYEVTEYGFNDGKVYISKEIQIADSSKRVFLERLADGETTIYYYRGNDIKTFFIEKDSTLFVELPKQVDEKEHFSEFLSNYTDDCSNVADACKLVSYKKKSLSRLITRYNTCELKPFPHFKYGFIIGYESSRLVPSNKKIQESEYIITNSTDDFEHFEYKYDHGIPVGLFLDNPILASDFSVHAELLFSKHGYSYTYFSANKSLDLDIKISTLRVPLLIRYTLPVNNLRPYFNAGPVYSYHIKNKSPLHKTTITNKVNKTIEEPVIPTNEIGYAVGCGIEFDLDYKSTLFVEIRYGNQFGISGDFRSRNSMLNISTGISF